MAEQSVTPLSLIDSINEKICGAIGIIDLLRVSEDEDDAVPYDRRRNASYAAIRMLQTTQDEANQLFDLAKQAEAHHG